MNNIDINMLTCTPVLAFRKLGPNNVPESPFLSPLISRETTPMLRGVVIRGNGDTSHI
jgi:hypothetical protein